MARAPGLWAFACNGLSSVGLLHIECQNLLRLVAVGLTLHVQKINYPKIYIYTSLDIYCKCGHRSKSPRWKWTIKQGRRLARANKFDLHALHELFAYMRLHDFDVLIIP